MGKVYSRVYIYIYIYIYKGSVIFHFDGRVDDDAHTDSESLQIDENKFLESTSEFKFHNFLNHSCNPNCFIEWQSLNLIALRDIQKSEELFYNYNTSEYDLINMAENCSFKCSCGSKDCVGEIKGFRYMTIEQKKKNQKFISPFLKERFEQEL